MTNEVEGATQWLRRTLEQLGVRTQGAEARVSYAPRTQEAELTLDFFVESIGWARAKLEHLDLRNGKLSFNESAARQAIVEEVVKLIVARATKGVPQVNAYLDVKTKLMGVGADMWLGLHVTSKNKQFVYVVGDDEQPPKAANWNEALPLLSGGKLVSAKLTRGRIEELLAELLVKNEKLRCPRVDALWGTTLRDTTSTRGTSRRPR